MANIQFWFGCDEIKVNLCAVNMIKDNKERGGGGAKNKKDRL